MSLTLHMNFIPIICHFLTAGRNIMSKQVELVLCLHKAEINVTSSAIDSIYSVEDSTIKSQYNYSTISNYITLTFSFSVFKSNNEGCGR